MVPKRLFVALALAVAAALPHAAAASNDDLAGRLQAFRVVVNAEGEETFLPAERAKPSDLIEYRLTYTNAGEDPIHNVLITDAIPAGMEYVEDSATSPKNGRVEFSIDGGKSYHQWPVMVTRNTEEGVAKTEPATPDMVTHVRWVFSGAFAPKREVNLSYRTLIE